MTDITKVHYELETRWTERGRKLMAWGFIGERRTLPEARAWRDELIRKHTDGPIVSGYEVRIVKVTTTETREVVPIMPTLPNLWMGEPVADLLSWQQRDQSSRTRHPHDCGCKECLI